MTFPNLLTSTTLSALLLAIASNIATSSAAPKPNVLTDMLLPTPNITGGPVAEIQCYALPYGAVGIISHLLTYWTIAWVAIGRVPIWPWWELETYGFDLCLSIASLCTCIPTAVITMYRCRLSWHFILISVWKLITSVSMACTSIHRCIVVRQEQLEEERRKDQLVLSNPSRNGCHHSSIPQSNDTSRIRKGLFGRRNGQSGNKKEPNLKPLLWLVLFLAGTVVGMIGLCSLLWTSFRRDQTVRNLTYGFAAPVVLVPLLVGTFWYWKYAISEEEEGGLATYIVATRHTLAGAFLAFVAVFGFFSALYGDLVLGAIADNLLGLPSADFAPLYWAWFAAKRITLLSF